MESSSRPLTPYLKRTGLLFSWKNSSIGWVRTIVCWVISMWGWRAKWTIWKSCMKKRCSWRDRISSKSSNNHKTKPPSAWNSQSTSACNKSKTNVRSASACSNPRRNKPVRIQPNWSTSSNSCNKTTTRWWPKTTPSFKSQFNVSWGKGISKRKMIT